MTGYKIVKKGRKGYITPLPPLSFLKTVETRLSYQKQGAHFMPNPAWANVKLFSIKTAGFPWGLLNEVLEVCKDWKSFKPEDDWKVIQLRSEKIIPSYSAEVRPYQKDAIDSLILHNGGILSMPTGSGKTFTAIEFVKQYKAPTLIICPTVYLVDQWKEQVPDYVDVRTYQGIKDFSILEKYRIVVFDECHHVAASTLYKIAMKLKEHIVVGLSATVTREDGEEMKMYGALGKVVYDISLRELINQGYLSDAEISWVSLSPHEQDMYMTFQEIYSDYIVNNVERNCLITFNALGTQKTLIIVNQIEHGKMLLEKLSGEDAIFLYSKSKTMDTNHRVIIATSIFDEGVDLPEMEVIIMAAGGKSSIKCTQRIGRVLRTYPGKDKALIIDFKDDAKYLNKHYIKRKEIYRDYGFCNR